MFRMCPHVFFKTLLGFILGSTKITNMKLWFLGSSHNLRQNLRILRGLSTRGKLGEMDVEPVYGIDPAVAGETFKLSDCGTILPVFLRTLPRDILAATVLANCPTLDVILNIFHQFLKLFLILNIQFTFL